MPSPLPPNLLQEYYGACTVAAEWLDRPLPFMFERHELAGARCGIYVGLRESPVADYITKTYVGKAVRGDGDVADRIEEHVKRLKRGHRFRWFMVVPLKDTTPPDKVFTVEGDIARYLGLPCYSLAIPRKR